MIHPVIPISSVPLKYKLNVFASLLPNMSIDIARLDPMSAGPLGIDVVVYRLGSPRNQTAEEGKMKQVMLLLGVLIMTGCGAEGTLAASGKCTVVKVDGVQMVIECNKETKGFAKGNEIKIKSNPKNNGRHGN